METASRQLKLPFVRVEDTIDVYVAARMAKVSTETIRRWCEQRIFPAWKMVGRWRIERSGFESWLKRIQADIRF